MTTMAVNERDNRVKAIREAGTLNGIDYLEVVSEDQRTVAVHFIGPLPGEPGGIPVSPPLSIENFRIDGGVRVKNIRVNSSVINGSLCTLTVDQAGDFSLYSLSIVTSLYEKTPPAGYDPLLSSISFSFKIGCPSEFDCASGESVSEKPADDLSIHYLAKDYNGFRRLMLERLGTLMPEWQERNPADIVIMLSELLAYEADKLSYYQDSVATEAYLGTARQRPSLRRHARLLDYAVHEGCNARTWIHIRVTPGGDLDGKSLPAGTKLIASSDAQTGPRIAPNGAEKIVSLSATVFETLHDQPLFSAHNEIALYTWSDSITCLPKGTTSFTLYNVPTLSLSPGDVLILEQVRSPITGAVADADPEKRHALRVLTCTPSNDPLDSTPLLTVLCHAQDALPFDMSIQVEVDYEGTPQKLAITKAFANIILADHGKSSSDSSLLVPRQVPYDSDLYAPKLSAQKITYSQPYTHHEAVDQAASLQLVQDPRRANAAVWLHDGVSSWVVQKDLLGSDRFAREFVAECQEDRTILIRFGDSIHGKKPSPGLTFTPLVRTGSGQQGNVGANAITKIITDFRDIIQIRNPLPAIGGKEPEQQNEIRRYAPQAFRIQKRAVIEADYADVAQLFPEVQRAKARFRWTGSWYTVFITIDRMEGKPVSKDHEFVNNLIQHLEAYRIAGYDIKISDPLFVPLDIVLRICCYPGYSPPDIKENLNNIFSSSYTNSGEKGFFHPDNHTFGTPLYLSRLYTTALSVSGVASAQALRFQRWDRNAHNELEEGIFNPSEMEIIRCDTDPNYPENGRITFQVYGA